MSTGAAGAAGGGDAAGQGVAGGDGGGVDVFGNPLVSPTGEGYEDAYQDGDDGFDQYDDDGYGDEGEISDEDVSDFVQDFPQLTLEDPGGAQAFVHLAEVAA